MKRTPFRENTRKTLGKW
uniref:Uncharacterized protein n=1 Tax=Moniliophthora roreri TaxID=221103 RepID=A0A0W0GCP9_MONRR